MRLPRTQRRRIKLEAWATLFAVTASLRIWGYRRVYAWLDRRTRGKASLSPDDASWLAPRIARQVRLAARPLPFATCLPRSLSLWWLLRRRGVPADFHVGVQRGEGRFKAHAWIEYNGRVLNDSADVRERFTPILQPTLPDSPISDREFVG